MVQCNSCGYENVSDAKFCINCGKKLEKTGEDVANDQNALSNDKKQLSRPSALVKIIPGLVGICCVGVILLIALGAILPDETLSGSLGTSSDLVKVSYPNPTNDYEKSVNELNKYATVYEGDTGDPYTLGVTYRNEYWDGVEYTVIIAEKDPFVVYHELAHVLNWGWSEHNCDWYAYNRTGYWA